MGNSFPYICLIKEMAVSCSSTPKRTKSWTSFLFIATFYNSRRPVPFLGLFLFEIALFPYFWKVFLCVSFTWELHGGGSSGSEKHGFVGIPVLATVLTRHTLPTTRGAAAQILHPRLLVTVGGQVWVWTFQIVLGEDQSRILIALGRAPGWEGLHIAAVILRRVGCAVVRGRKPWVFAGLTLLTPHLSAI